MSMKWGVDILKRLQGNISLEIDGVLSAQAQMNKDTKIVDIHDFSFEDPGEDNIFEKLSKARDLGSILKEEGQTLIVRHKGKDVMKFGKDANPKLSLLATMSRDVEITDIIELRRLSKTIDPEEEE